MINHFHFVLQSIVSIGINVPKEILYFHLFSKTKVEASCSWYFFICTCSWIRSTEIFICVNKMHAISKKKSLTNQIASAEKPFKFTNNGETIRDIFRIDIFFFKLWLCKCNEFKGWFKMENWYNCLTIHWKDIHYIWCNTEGDVKTIKFLIASSFVLSFYRFLLVKKIFYEI